MVLTGEKEEPTSAEDPDRAGRRVHTSSALRDSPHSTGHEPSTVVHDDVLLTPSTGNPAPGPTRQAPAPCEPPTTAARATEAEDDLRGHDRNDSQIVAIHRRASRGGQPAV